MLSLTSFLEIPNYGFLTAGIKEKPVRPFQIILSTYSFTHLTTELSMESHLYGLGKTKISATDYEKEATKLTLSIHKKGN